MNATRSAGFFKVKDLELRETCIPNANISKVSYASIVILSMTIVYLSHIHKHVLGSIEEVGVFKP